MNKKKISRLKNFIIIACTLLVLPIELLLFITHTSILTYPSTIKTSGRFCLQGYFIFPNHYRITTSIPSEIEIENKVNIFDRFDIFSNKICIKPIALLGENTPYSLNSTYIDTDGLGIFIRKINMTTEQHPQIKAHTTIENINTDHILQYELSENNEFLEYAILGESTSIKCRKEELKLSCDISELNLLQENTYELKLVSMYQETIVKELESTNVNILSDISIVNSSIANKGVIQSTSIPLITLEVNKEIEQDFQVTIEDSEKNQIKTEYTLQGQTISIVPLEGFKQASNYFLKVNNIKGKDGSRLRGEYVLEFSIDDGPKITTANISNGFSTSGDIVLTFNQALVKSQDIKKYIKLESDSAYSYSINSNKVTINPNSTLTPCKSYKLTIDKGLMSTTNLIASKGYSNTFKTSCKKSTSIGTSVQGRSIPAYYFGTGSKKIILFGSMHGSEANTKAMLNKLITDLETNSNNIPADKTIIIVPTINPDGIANKTRFNANGVDLNRNFDNANWISGTYFLNNFYPTGGGLTPFSEPESVAIKNLVERESPYLTISYHSAAGYVIPNETSMATEVGKTYSLLSGYRYIAPGTQGAFTYDITGTFERWAGEHGHSVLVVELSSAYSDQFTMNKKAIWEMINK